MDKVIEQVKSLLAKYHGTRLVLFGSRARGDFRERSDYDFAIWGLDARQQALFQDEVENNLDTLFMIDLVFIGEQTDAALLKSIEKDGIVLMDRYKIKYTNLQCAIQSLQEGLDAYGEHPAKIVRDGVIQRFEFTCELAWKTVREFLLDQNFTEIDSPKATMRQAFAYGLISDQAGWTELLNARNHTSHIYDDATAEAIFHKIEKQFIQLFTELLQRLEKE